MHGHDQKPKPALFTIIFLAACNVLALNIFLPSLPDMAVDFAVSNATMSLSFSGYLVAIGLLTLVMGPLSDRFGRRPVALVSIAIFTVASVGVALAVTPAMFFVSRFLQATAVCAIVLSQAIVRDIANSPEQAARDLAMVSMVMALGPMVAPSLGGVMADLFGWRSNFWMLAVYGGGLFALCWFNLYETNQQRGGNWRHQMAGYRALITTTQFWAHVGNLVTMAGMFYVFLVAIPLVGAAELSLSKSEVGLMMGALPIGYIAGNYLTRRASQRWGLANLIGLGRIVAIASPLLCLVLAWTSDLHPLLALSPLILTGVGNGLAIPTGNAAIVSIDTRFSGTAAGLSGAIIQLISAGIVQWSSANVGATPTAATMLWSMLAIGVVGVVPTAVILWLRHRPLAATAAAP